jgi:molybdate transport system regulatory protein
MRVDGRNPLRNLMENPHLWIRLDLGNGRHIGPGKIALLKAIRAEGSITAAARHLGMSYRRAWQLVENINDALRKPAVSSVQGGQYGGGTVLTDVGEQIVQIYHSVEGLTLTSAHRELRAIARLGRD